MNVRPGDDTEQEKALVSEIGEPLSDSFEHLPDELTVAKSYREITGKTWPRQDIKQIPKHHASDLDRN